MTDEAHSAQALAARLIAHARTDGRNAATRDVDAALLAFQRMAVELSRWMGAGGAHALLARALRKASAHHPALQELDVDVAIDPRPDRLLEIAEVHGADAIAAGLEATLVTLFQLLGRLIGEDLATRFVELTVEAGMSEPANPDDEREVHQ